MEKGRPVQKGKKSSTETISINKYHRYLMVTLLACASTPLAHQLLRARIKMNAFFVLHSLKSTNNNNVSYRFFANVRICGFLFGFDHSSDFGHSELRCFFINASWRRQASPLVSRAFLTCARRNLFSFLSVCAIFAHFIRHLIGIHAVNSRTIILHFVSCFA